MHNDSTKCLPDPETETLDNCIRVKCGGPAHGGAMVARHHGRVIFVDGALPNEDVTVCVTEEKKSFVRGYVVDIHSANPERRDHVCEAAAAGAGCCTWDNASLTLQRTMKAQIVDDLLHRIGGCSHIPWKGSVTPLSGETLSGEPNTDGTQWRVRQRLSINSRGEVGPLAARSHTVIAATCSQVVPLLSGSPREWGIADEVASLAGTSSELVLTADSLGERHIVSLTREQRHYRGSRRAQATARRAHTSHIVRREVLEGSGMATERVLGQEWHIPADSFWQAHYAAPAVYAQLVCDCADLHDGESAWDLYGGCGIFAHALSRAASHSCAVVSVDTAGPAIAAGKASFRHTGQKISMVESSVSQWLHKGVSADDTAPATVVLDPPRAGAGKDVVCGVAAHQPRTVMHFGCDAAAFARDLHLWKENGYGISEVRIFDSFPNTPHMECFALLRRLL